MEDKNKTEKELDHLNNEFGDINIMEDLKEIDNIKENINSSNLIINDAKKILSSIRTETGKKKRKKYTLKQKAAVLNLIENKISRHEIERDYGINRKSIKEWESKKDQILNSLKKNLIITRWRMKNQYHRY